ncbi:aldo/keto reductase [Serratia marcescens]|jgi:aryl-alcohol dehydrogenase-like predicted oxidoreductase|uniref:Aldo/keto reductase n=1 Tax=Serratia marcescens TaxID=615 RepID=A0AAP8PEV1_SERMA|nr:aldo/keto reductase [Serratia marcescens]RNW11832.1 aldo/keto reductase [Serratia nematodiphila]MBH1894408.1 aldo/keto reductase [Serratia marcescens]MBN5208073.1 aldo/keto reductase [Serratia marcescens]PNO64778.1 aldo/keto reductase [Serratia marcescens]BEM84396.1 oxidoreductase [Serratia marcescens]
MKERTLGNGLTVSAMGFGAMGLSEFYGDTDDNTSLAVLKTVIDTGINFIDTANLYGRGHNERLLGHFLATLGHAQRNKIKIATKCGIDRADDNAYARRINNQPDYIRRCCHESLQRLGVERIDLYYLHRVDPQADIEESMDCLSQLVKEGKIAQVGLCEVSAATLEKAHRIHPISALQTEYSLWTRDIEESVLPAAIRLGVGVVPYSPLGRGFLTGKYLSNQAFADNDFRKNNERFIQSNIEHNAEILQAIAPLAEKYQCTPGQVSLAWLLAQYERIVPIPGTKNSHYAIENAQAENIILAEEDLTLLNTLKEKITIMGERYSPEGMKGVNA